MYERCDLFCCPMVVVSETDEGVSDQCWICLLLFLFVTSMSCIMQTSWNHSVKYTLRRAFQATT